MSNAPIIKGISEALTKREKQVQQTATVRKQTQTAAKGVAGERREAVAAAAERSAAARARRGRGGYRSLLSRARGGRSGELASKLGGTE